MGFPPFSSNAFSRIARIKAQRIALSHDAFATRVASIVMPSYKLPTICMDFALIDLGEHDPPVGSEVILFGDGDIDAQTIASLTGQIPYEVICSPSKRVKRVYQKKSGPEAKKSRATKSSRKSAHA